MLDSAMFNLRNPAFTDDVCTGFIDRQFPVTIDPLMLGTYKTGVLPPINAGQPANDTYEGKTSRKKAVFTRVLAGGLLVGGAILAFLKRKNIATFFNKIFQNARNTRVYHYVRSKISP